MVIEALIEIFENGEVATINGKLYFSEKHMQDRKLEAYYNGVNKSLQPHEIKWEKKIK